MTSLGRTVPLTVVRVRDECVATCCDAASNVHINRSLRVLEFSQQIDPNHRCLGICCHRGKLRTILNEFHRIVGDNQAVLGIDGDLHVVTEQTGAATDGRRGVGLQIGQRRLLINAWYRRSPFSFKLCCMKFWSR